MLILLRHGQSTLNAESRLVGRLDPPLTPLGESQARAAAIAVGAFGPPSRVVSSPLLRARQTAAALVAAGLPAAVQVDDRWSELDYGDYDGAPLAEVPGAVWDAWRADENYAPTGGESLAALGARVREACAEVDAASGPVVVVSHVSPIKAAVVWALGVSDRVAWRMFLAPASITCISLTERGPSLHAFNLTAHLQG